jgi:hypothetical protein
LLLVAWFFRSEPTFTGAEIVGSSLALVLSFFTCVIIGLTGRINFGYPFGKR